MKNSTKERKLKGRFEAPILEARRSRVVTFPTSYKPPKRKVEPVAQAVKAGEYLDLNRHVLRHPAATFYARAAGNAMTPLIHHGDLLIVDRIEAHTATEGDVVVAKFGEDYVARRIKGNRLIAEASGHVDIELSECEMWGRVTFVVRELNSAQGETR